MTNKNMAQPGFDLSFLGYLCHLVRNFIGSTPMSFYEELFLKQLLLPHEIILIEGL